MKFVNYIDPQYQLQIEYKSFVEFQSHKYIDCLQLIDLKNLNFQALSHIKINKISLVKLYDIINTAITTPIYIARFRPGSLFSPVLNEVTLSDMLVIRLDISIDETFAI